MGGCCWMGWLGVGDGLIQIVIMELDLWTNSPQRECSQFLQGGDEDYMAKQVGRLRRVKYLRQLLGGLNSIRRQVDVERSQREVLNEHKAFRIIQQWRRLAAQGRQKRLQAEIMHEKMEWRTKRQCFKEWMNILRRRKIAQHHYTNKVFQALKVTCCSEYAIRLRKIQLQTALQKATATQFIYLLRVQHREMQEKHQIAIKHHKNRVLQTCFNALQTVQAKGKRSRIRYQEYKLAHLFHVRSLLRKAWQALSS